MASKNNVIARGSNDPTVELDGQSPLAPEAVRPLLGPSWVVEGEDPNLYEELLGRVGAAVEPRDIIDWLLVKDMVALTWQIHRSRRQRESLVRSARGEAMERLMSIAWPGSGGHPDQDEDSPAKQLADEWFVGGKGARRSIDGYLKRAGLSWNDVGVQALSIKAEELDRLDLQNESYENRRDAILQQIERRRRGWSRVVKHASEDIVDAEFTETPDSDWESRVSN